MNKLLQVDFPFKDPVFQQYVSNTPAVRGRIYDINVELSKN